MKSHLLIVAAAGLMGISGCEQAPAPPPATKAAGDTYTVHIFMDGGYYVDFSKSDYVDIHALAGSPFALKVREIPAAGPEMDVTGYRLSLLPGGQAPTARRPDIPPLDRTQTGCMDDKYRPNNRLFIPNIPEIAAIMGTTVNINPTATLHLTGGGELSIRRVGGCTEFRDGQNQSIGAPRSMVSGIEGLLYEWRDVPGTQLILEATPLSGTGTAIQKTVTPKNGLIVLRVSSLFATAAKPMLDRETILSFANKTTPYEVDFMSHFKSAFAVYDAMKFKIWWLGTYFVTPGVDCATGGG